MAIKKSKKDGVIAGVVAGVSKATDIDMTLLRVAAVALGLVTGPLAVVAYIAGALLMEDDEPKPLND